MHRARALLAGLVLVGTGALAAVGILSLLPAGNAIPGWSVVAAADKKGCTAQDFYSMYDGAAPAMMQAGIIGAGQRIYQNGSKHLTVDLYRFQTVAQARSYYAQRKAEIAGKREFWARTRSTQGVARAVCGRTTVAYQWVGRTCCTLAVNGVSAADRAALEAFTAVLASQVAAHG